MKAIILTFSKVNNRGANLQCFALLDYLRKKGITVELLDIQLPKPRNLIHQFDAIFNNILANRFRQQVKLNFTKKYYSYNDLKDNPPRADIYIVGSDQVWNTKITSKIDPRIYFYTFLPKTALKVAYAASFGTNEWYPTKYDKEIIESLKTFKYISVREDSGIAICKKEFGINDVAVVLDPSLLLTQDDVLSLFKIKPEKNQIFSYLLYNNDSITGIIEKVKNITNLPVIGSQTKKNLINKIKTIYTIPKWLSNIQCSNLVITNSFHCIVFSILLQKQFIAIPSAPGKSERILSLLRKLDLENRFILSKDQLDSLLLQQKIDYDKVNSKLSEERQMSIAYIDNIIDSL